MLWCSYFMDLKHIRNFSIIAHSGSRAKLATGQALTTIYETI